MKRWLFILVLLVILFIVGFWVYWASSPLITPFLTQALYPDLSSKLSKRVTVMPTLDYQSSMTVPTLSEKVKYLVFNSDTGRVYASKGADEMVAPASFTKLLTAQVALDVATTTARLEATTTSVNKEPTILELKAGEILSLQDLLRGSIATSANDAAATVGEGVAALYNQKLDFFVDLMNQKAKLLKMNQSHFVNPEGYDDPYQYSTFEDLAKLVVNTIVNYPEIESYGSSDRADIQKTDTHGRYYLPNWNGLLKVYPGVNGLKIAYTELAGYSTIVTAKRQDVRVVVILGGADSILERDLAAGNLLDAAFIAEKIPPANITKTKLKRRYQEWTDLVALIKAELKAIEESKH